MVSKHANVQRSHTKRESFQVQLICVKSRLSVSLIISNERIKLVQGKTLTVNCYAVEIARSEFSAYEYELNRK